MSDFPDRKHVKQVVAKDIKARGNVSIGKIVQIANQTINQIVKPAYHRSPSVWLAQGGLVIALIVLLVAAIKGGFSSSNSLSTTYAPSTTIENKNTFLISNLPLNLLSKTSPSEAEKNDSQQKVVQYQQEVKKNPNSAVAHTNLGEALRRVGDLEGSSKEHQKALQLNPKLQEAKVGQALVEQDQGKLEAAIKAIRDALAQETDQKVLALFYFYLGNIFYFQEPQDIKTAEAAWQKSIELDPNLVDAHVLLGEVKILQYKFNEGIAYLEKAKVLLTLQGDIKKLKLLNKALGFAHGLLAASLGEEKKFDQAVAELQKGIALNPDYADAYNLLGGILALQGKSIDAVKPLKKARDLYRAEGKTQKADRVDQLLQKVGTQ